MTPEIKRILYATDLSDNSAYAFAYALTLANKYDAEIIVLHVIDRAIESSQTMFAGYINYVQLEEDLSKRMTRIHEEINHRLKIIIDEKVGENPEFADKIASVEVCMGYPADEILIKADALHCDLIVMGTHGKGIVSHAFFGSVAKKVLRRVRKPVFIIPLPAE